jgi:hypothetical protein
VADGGLQLQICRHIESKKQLPERHFATDVSSTVQPLLTPEANATSGWHGMNAHLTTQANQRDIANTKAK